MKDIKFGFCVPIFANPGILFFRTPAYKKLDWNSIKETIIMCEDLGYDSAFVADHFFLGTGGEIWECMSVMAALMVLTKKMHIIPIHLCNNFRFPGIVAKALSTMSHISNGRVELFYDYGRRKAEFDSYGIDFGNTDHERIQQMAEGLTIIKGMMEKDKFSFEGKYYKIKNAVCNPKPVKKIPVWMGGANNSEMVTNIVKFTDVFNSRPCAIKVFEEKLNIIKKECKNQRRNFSEIGLSLETQVLIRKTRKDVEEDLDRFADLIGYNNSYDADSHAQLKTANSKLTDYNSTEILKKKFMIGTPEEIKQRIDSFIEKGVSHFMLWFMDYPSQQGIKLFAEEILPYYK